MPFIRGRYHINAIMGEALEAAREAEAALLALKQDARQNGDSAQDEDDAGDDAIAAKGPVHRVEIEAAEMVPSHSGRGQRGYAMRIHRLPPPSAGDPDTDFTGAASTNGSSGYGSASRYGSRNSAAAPSASQSDTHIFSNHNDMLDYLRDELAEDFHEPVTVTTEPPILQRHVRRCGECEQKFAFVAAAFQAGAVAFEFVVHNNSARKLARFPGRAMTVTQKPRKGGRHETFTLRRRGERATSRRARLPGMALVVSGVEPCHAPTKPNARVHRLFYNGGERYGQSGSHEMQSGQSPPWKSPRRRHRPFVRAGGTRYAQWTVLLIAALLLGRLVWQGMYTVLRPTRSQVAVQPAAPPPAANTLSAQAIPWQRDVLSSIEDSRFAAQSGNITAAEVAADRAASIITGARLQSQPATPDFFALASDALDRVLLQDPNNERLLEHVTDTRIELAQLRTWQDASADGSPTQNDGQATVAAANRNLPGHIAIETPREISANQILNPKSLGGNYLDATLMADSAEILLPPASRLPTDNIRVEDLTIAGAAQTLDNLHWKNVTFIGTRLRFDTGSIDLQNVHFVLCTFGFPSDARGAQLANAIALGESSITIQ